jgi:hypothetical protein
LINLKKRPLNSSITKISYLELLLIPVSKKKTKEPMKYIFHTLFIALILSSCGDSEDKDAYKPRSTGTQGIIEIVLEQNLWDGRLGEIIKDKIAPMIEYYPNEEYLFDLHQSTKSGFQMGLKRQRYIIQFITAPNSSVKPDINYATNIWAEDQSIVRIIGSNQQDFYDIFIKNAQQIQDYFMKKEIERMKSVLIKDQNYLAKRKLIEKHNLSLTIPSEMELSINNGSFAAMQSLRLVSTKVKSPGDVQQFVMVYHYPYTDKNQLTKKSLLAVRDSVVKKYFRGNVEDSYMTTAPDSLVPSFEKETLFKGVYAFEIRGLYSMVNDFRGGPFVSITLVDEARGRIVTVEGHVFCPKFDKRPYMMELETILNTLTLE